MTVRNPMVFWYDFASPYCYLAAERVGRLSQAVASRVEWRPFLLGPLFRQHHPDGLPRQQMSAAARTNKWRDLERLAADLRIPFAPDRESYPPNGLRAARLVLGLASRQVPEAQVNDMALAIFRAAFRKGQDISDLSVLRGLLADAGLPAELAEAAGTDTVKRQLIDNGAEAEAAGIFGAPSFVVTTGDGTQELFFGQDRLDQALRWSGIPVGDPADAGQAAR